ncbi:MAG: thiolase family protein [Hyphomicrobiaceae bacterium]|nr:thiolase family protein [Hyphomicrobiaceae bacterium]
MQPPSAYIIAARRSALGRVGGLHRTRRIDALTAPIVEAVLADANIEREAVDEVIIGNATEGGNPARLIALAAGLPETVSATTIDRQCGSGLEAILAGIRAIGLGEAEIVIAGGADSLSTAPWRIMRPRSLYQTPHFMRYEPTMVDAPDEPQPFEASEELAKRYGITRKAQDTWALASHRSATAAREARRFVGEIVALRSNADEARDQSATSLDDDEVTDAIPFLPEDGTLTPANSASMHDGAAIVAIVSEGVWQRLGRPPALQLIASASQGVGPDAEAEAPIAATRKLYKRLNGMKPAQIGVVELSESSAAQAIAFTNALQLAPDIINPAGGAVVRGHPFGASGAVLVVRLFTTMARNTDESAPKFGLVSQGAIGGLGLSALFARA